MIRAVVLVAAGVFLFINPSVGLSQMMPFPEDIRPRPRPNQKAKVTRNQIIKEGSKQFDQFVRWARSSYSLPFEFSEVEKANLVGKYLRETDKSPFFWTHLENTFRKVKEDRPSGNASPPADVVAADIVRGVYFLVMAQNWGSLALISEPAGAEVFLQISSSRTNEGKTKINRKYPEGNYTFILESSGFKSKEIYVTIARDKPVEVMVMLEKY